MQWVTPMENAAEMALPQKRLTEYDDNFNSSISQ